MSWYRWDAEDLVLTVKAKPNARQAGVDGVHDDAVRIAIQAPAREARANEALLAYLAAAFAVPRRRVVLERGARGRDKRLRIVAPDCLPGWFVELGGAARAAGLPPDGNRT
ncbi:MAG: DUF167 family protein [Gammaproteobacteria bacterium]